MRFDCVAYFTVVSFFLSTLIDMVYSVVILLGNKDYKGYLLVPERIGQSAIIAIFFTVMYEMRIVKIKLECDEFYTYRRRLARQRCYWFGIYMFIAANLVLNIFNDSQELNILDLEPGTMQFNTSLVAIGLSLVMDPFLVIELYRYFCFFFQKKKESLTRQYGIFTCRQKAVVIFCISVFVFSGIVLLLDDLIELLLLCKVITELGIQERWYVATYVLYEVLILTNGIMFLYFFKHMTMYQLAKQGRTSHIKKKTGNLSPGKVTTAMRQSEFDSADSVYRVKQILEKSASSYNRSKLRGPSTVEAPLQTGTASNNAYTLRSEVEHRGFVGEDDDEDEVRRLPSDANEVGDDVSHTINTSLNGHSSHAQTIQYTAKNTNSKNGSNVSLMHQKLQQQHRLKHTDDSSSDQEEGKRPSDISDDREVYFDKLVNHQ